MLETCIDFYVSKFGDSADGVFYSIIWVVTKILGNCFGIWF